MRGFPARAAGPAVTAGPDRGCPARSGGRLGPSARKAPQKAQENQKRKLRKAEFEAGVAEGEIKAKKEAAIEMAKTGISEVQIDSILKIEKTVICQWFREEENACSEMD